jgi:hypothetical protein
MQEKLSDIFASLVTAQWVGPPARIFQSEPQHMTLTDIKALSHQTALSLRLHGVVKFNKAPRDRNKTCYIFDDMKTSRSVYRPCHVALTYVHFVYKKERSFV